MLRFFDINCSIGKRDAPGAGSFYTVEKLKEKMKLCDIEKALVFHAGALELHPIIGNKEILKIAEKDSSILPLWLVMPNHTGEFFDPDLLIEMMKKSNVRAVKLYPRYNSLTYSLEEWSCGELLDALEQNRVPVLIDIEETDWNLLYKICKNHPQLNIIVTNVYYRNARYFYPLLKETNNLFIEISLLKNYMGIEDACNRFGPERLIFGTGMSVMDPGPAIAMVLYANMPYEYKEFVACKNFEKLLGLRG